MRVLSHLRDILWVLKAYILGHVFGKEAYKPDNNGVFSKLTAIVPARRLNLLLREYGAPEKYAQPELHHRDNPCPKAPVPIKLRRQAEEKMKRPHRYN